MKVTLKVSGYTGVTIGSRKSRLIALRLEAPDGVEIGELPETLTVELPDPKPSKGRLFYEAEGFTQWDRINPENQAFWERRAERYEALKAEHGVK